LNDNGRACVVDVNRAGEGELEIMVNKGTVANSVRMMSTGVFQVSFVPKEPKPHSVDIKFNSTPLPRTSKDDLNRFHKRFEIWDDDLIEELFYLPFLSMRLHINSPLTFQRIPGELLMGKCELDVHIESDQIKTVPRKLMFVVYGVIVI